ncbi:MAG: prepilin-type N-terminal cleavage/methylation domain-containing protein [Pirellula sp.]|jgi:prepilin-type N-terminal cleavage/methylation domain-containing protein
MLQQRTAKWNRSKVGRSGFTLTELLVVIAIIAVIAGLALPAIFAARVSFDRSRMKMEVQSIEDAVEKYKSQYGDYPPDGSSWSLIESHLRKIFPEILTTELALLNPANAGLTAAPLAGQTRLFKSDYESRVMDPAEAIVFFLGGFSSNKQKPFTGKGGPFVNVGTAAAPVWDYNPSRENGFYEFKGSQLNFFDESNRGFPNSPPAAWLTNDLFPVYLTSTSGNPFVYFDSRTYHQILRPTPVPVYQYYSANLAPMSNDGAIRPLLNITPEGPGAVKTKYENPNTFQILASGLDGKYGGRLPQPFIQSPSTTAPAVWHSVRGDAYVFNTATTQFVRETALGARFGLPEHGTKNTFLDNVANCVEPPMVSQNQ